MTYKVFFVEDEIVTREGVRDNVDWQASGFAFCGEAADGEMALPLIRTTRPDVLITDIKMPFMDGLQLCKIMRESMPWVKIVILSGHDEFEYAQKAINLGATDYLLKPVTVEKLHQVLHKLAAQLDQEKKEQENLKKLQEQIEENQAMLRERLLLKLVVGAISSTEAIETGQMLGLDLIARCYLVVILKTEPGGRAEPFDYAEYQWVRQMVTSLVENNPDIFCLNKDFAEIVLVMKGNTPEYLEEERDILLERIEREAKETRYQLAVGTGTSKTHITDIYQSFIEALASIQNAGDLNGKGSIQAVDSAELLKVDKSAVAHYLRCGTKEDFGEFFAAYILPLGEAALKSHLIKDYIFMDIVLATADLINDLGGEIDLVIPELTAIEKILSNIKTIEQLKEYVYDILTTALAFRDGQSSSQYTGMIRLAKEYIESHYSDPDLSLDEVSAHVCLSSSHFSMVFSQETGQTFKECLTELRIKKAQELLRTTSLRATEIAYQVGYNDPHYFSAAFKKKTGLSPIEFRLQATTG
jgi:two-component system, response regulator YesN